MLSRRHVSGFTSAELLVSMAIGALVVGAAAVAFGTFVSAQPKVGASANVVLDTARLQAYYGLNQSSIQAVVAPNYGALARAESLRERFLADTLGATGVYCLARNQPNTYHPYSIPYDPATATRVLDSSIGFFQHIYDQRAVTGVTATSFIATARNLPPAPSGDTYNYGASIFVLGYSGYVNTLVVTAIYDIDVDKVISPAGFYASVKRWAASATSAPKLTGYYDVFYPASDTSRWPSFTTDEFAPLWVAFERRVRKAKTEAITIDRFKVAHEQPFFMIWWPDPALRNLDARRAKAAAPPPSSPTNAYYMMAGRTSFMFTVPMFPSST